MASFQIYQDVENENPQIVSGNTAIGVPLGGILKERKTAGHGLSGKNVSQAQTRSNFSVLNINTNAGNGTRHGREGAGKLALRTINNTNELKEANNEFGKSGKETKIAITKPKLTTKTTTSTTNNANTLKVSETIAASTQQIKKATTTNEEEHINILTQLEFEKHHHEHQQITVENDPLHKNVFNTTPMSVSDVLSPMSVDRSNLSVLDSIDKENQPDLLQQLQQQKLKDESINLNVSTDEVDEAQHKTVEQQEQRKLEQIVRNDRQRFFEVVEYQDAILEYFREGEKKHRPKPHYMRRQPDINHSMRTILVDWLVEVSEEYNLDTETLYLSISYIDRFLSHMSVVRSKLQLVGTAAMYIAAKYEEIYPPDVGEFVFITDDTYTKAQVLRMEQLILKILAFDLCTPTPYVFVNTYAVLTDMTNDLKFLTMYICELSLLEADPYLNYVPSIVSAASHALARYILDYAIWSTDLEEVTTYRLEDLKEVFLHLCNTHKMATTLPQQAIQEKYKSKKYNEVSILKPVELTSTKLDEIIANYNETSAAEKARLEREKAAATTNNENVRRMISLMFN